MGSVLDVLIFGFLISSLYALAAVGFTMIFGVAGVLNLAHGAFVMVGAYLAIWASTVLGWDIYAATSLAVAAMALIAPLIYLVFVRPVIHRPVTVFLGTLLLAVVAEQIMILIFSPNPRTLKALVGGYWTFLDVTIPWNRVVASLIALVSIVALWFFVNRTRTGKAITALSMERVGAALVGIYEYRIQLVVWALSGALAAIAGVFLTSFLGMSPFGGRVPLVVSFSIVVLGGLGSIPGSLWAAYIIGYAETITTQFVPEARGLPSLVILLLILTFKPQGLFGRDLS